MAPGNRRPRPERGARARPALAASCLLAASLLAGCAAVARPSRAEDSPPQRTSELTVRASPAPQAQPAVVPEGAAGASSPASRETGAVGGPVAAGRRFFLSGDGELALENGHTGERLRVRFRDASGAYDPRALAAIDALFRSRGDGRRTRPALRLIELIDYLQDRERPEALVLMSGYRSGEYNATVIARGGQAARASMHTEGLAADLVFVGVDQRALWERVRELGCCGAGWYASNGFLHFDVGRPRFWEESTSRVRENLSRGNARLIARTDFDRYGAIDGATIGLHAVTLRPLRISRRAQLSSEGDGASVELRLEREGAPGTSDDPACLEFAPAAAEEPIVLRATTLAAASAPASSSTTKPGSGRGAVAPGPSPARGRIVVHTCEPRLEATPALVETNPIEVGVPGIGAMLAPAGRRG